MSGPVESVADLLQQARDLLTGLLGEGWRVEETTSAELVASDERPRHVDGVWRLRHDDSSKSAPVLLIEVKRGPLTPLGARSSVEQLRHYMEVLRARGESATPVIVTSWFSPRTQHLLDEEGVGYIDPTGNVSLRVDRPLIVLKTTGATRSPRPELRPQRGLSGPRAGRLVRELVDFEPPRQAAELVERTRLSQGYVSKLLDTMVSEALIKRDENRLVVAVDWAGLLRARASSSRLMSTVSHVGAIARRGRPQLLQDLREGRNTVPVVLTGSYAADQVAPTSIGGALIAYVPPGEDALRNATKSLGLLRVDTARNAPLSGADVLLLQSPDDTPFVRTQRLDGIEAVAYSQLALDCLSGPGRMPAEGEAVLGWMAANTSAWRSPSPLV
jgi:hypothetical protein